MIDDARLLRTAFHESGHIIMARERNVMLESATVRTNPVNGQLGLVCIVIPREPDRAFVLSDLLISLAGPMAEAIHVHGAECDLIPSSAWSKMHYPDFRKAWHHAQRLQRGGDLLDEAGVYLHDFFVTPRNWHVTTFVAERLLEAGELNAAEIHYAIQDAMRLPSKR